MSRLMLYWNQTCCPGSSCIGQLSELPPVLESSMTKEEIILANRDYLFPSIFHYYKEPLVVSHAKDQYVWDADGNQYLDFFGGIVTISVGHCNDDVNRKVHAQMDRLQHVSTVFANEPQAALAKKLATISPGGKLTKSFFTNSGTEANENAILTARCYTGSSEVVGLRYAYHGRSSLAMGLTAQSSWRLGPVTQAGIVHAVNAYCYRCPFGLTYPSCEVKCAQDVEEVIRTTTSGRIAAFIAEPIQGIGGFVTPPKEYFPIVADIVKKYGGLFISDEVQTGWGRTGGKWFGIEQWGVQPDIITSAKGLGNGTPIGLTMARPEIADSLKGATISTFGGNPVTTTAAKAVIDFIEEHNLSINAAEVGAYLHNKLEDLKAKFPIIGDVRGMGLMQGIELVEDRESKKPATAQTLAVMEATRENRILLGKGGFYGNVLRISPPMNISKTDVDEFARLLDASFVKAQTAMAAA
jgi:4-aminobutyrate aminotransferase-like enzyme